MQYRISVGFLILYLKIDERLLFTSKNNMNRLFKANAKADVPNEPQAQIIFHDMPYFSYQQITLDDNFLTYFNGILTSRGALRIGVISSPYQQSFEINTGTQSLKVIFHGLNKQIDRKFFVQKVGQKVFWFLTKVTNIKLFTIASMQSWRQNMCNFLPQKMPPEHIA